MTVTVSVSVCSTRLMQHVASAQTQPDVADVLKKVSETYANPKEYQFVGTETSKQLDRSGDTKVETQSVEIAVRHPNKLRMTRSGDGMVTVVDGVNSWVYLPKIKQYIRYEGAPVHTDPHDNESETKPGAPSEFITHFEGMFFYRYRSFMKIANRAKLLRDENITAEGKNVACYVVEIGTDSPPTSGPSRGTYRWWVAKKSYLVLREDNALKNGRFSASTSYSIARINQRLPDGLFVFSQPSDAKQVDTFE
jgi:outer membrane lipoprotein-sorting protein